MTENGEPAPEVVDILRALRDRKKYFRLKDGSFLDLSEMDEWREMAEAAVGSETGEPEDEEKERARRDGNRRLPRGVHDEPAGERRYSRQG